MGERQLGKRSLLPAASEREQMALLWVFNLSGGTNSVLDIAERSGLSFEELPASRMR
jgi:aminopeptidase-like protein